MDSTSATRTVPTGRLVITAERRRRFGRLRQDTLQCNLGEVLDLSMGGMRVKTRGLKVGESVSITFEDHELPGPLQAIVVWTRRMGWFKSEAGIKFETVTPEMIAALGSICRDNRVCRSL